MLLEIVVYTLIVLSTILLSLNIMSVSFHFKEGFARDGAKKGSWLEKRLKSKSLASIIISIVFTMLSIIFILNICDLLFNKSFIGVLSILFLFLTILLTIKSSSYKILNHQLNDKIVYYFNNSINAFGFALFFSFILSIIDYQYDIVEKTQSLAEYFKNHQIQDGSFTLYTFFQILSVIKSSFFYYLLQYIDSSIVKYIFAFLTFTQSFFLFYYTSILVATAKNISQLEDKSKNAIAPLIISLMALAVFHFYQREAIEVPKRIVTATIESEQNINNQINENKDFKTKVQESEKELLNMKNKLEDTENKFKTAKNKLESFKNAKLSKIGLLKCSMPFVECTVKDIIDID